MKIEAGKKIQARVPFSNPNTTTVHINAVIPSFHYSDKALIIYSVYGKHKQWWHEIMCTEDDMKHYIEMAKILRDKNPTKPKSK